MLSNEVTWPFSCEKEEEESCRHAVHANSLLLLRVTGGTQQNHQTDYQGKQHCIIMHFPLESLSSAACFRPGQQT